ncbi:MAG: sulfite exporter TauE/SafE family protein [Nitrososphaerota archaeon]|nr:sulfite exporter TauE/SafE family protein [Nitrososphaerota archaeon]
MAFDITILAFLALLSLAASVVNGGLGYGYSSLSTPLAILVIVNRIINPVYVLVEGLLNVATIGLTGFTNVKSTFRRVLPIMIALVPGVIIGSFVLTSVAPTWVRFFTYLMILPLILLQAGGVRRPVKSERAAGVPLGLGVGLLYSITTISGPPIALFWNNQGVPKGEFRAAIAQIRITESAITIAVYSFLGLFTASTFQLFTYVAPPVLLGIPLGFLIVRRVGAEVFRRICMSFDAWIVAYGLSVVLGSLFGLLNLGYAVLAATTGIDAFLLYKFFGKRRLPPVLLGAPGSRGHISPEAPANDEAR